MNKRLVTILLSLAVAAVPAFAGIVTVDFGELGASTVVLTPTLTDPAGLSATVTRLIFSYNQQGGTDAVSVDSSGIVGTIDFGQEVLGTISGDLVILFPYAVTGLGFTFSNDPNNDVYGFFTSALDGSSSDPIFGASDGTFSYGAAFGGPAVSPFSRVDLYFGNGDTSTSFTVDSMQYDYTPEPVSFFLMGTGLLGLGCVRRFRRKS